MSVLEQNVIKFISDNKLIDKGDKILLAFSGGGDSVFALFFLNKYKHKYKIDICALHVNHSLRGDESDSDEEFCRSMCENLDIEFYSEKVVVLTLAKKEKLSIEEAARNLRYNKLNEYLTISSSNKIVTAHNLDDNTETVFLNLVRGTGLKGLSGIPIKRNNIVRPFLILNKSDIIEYLNINSIKFRIDSTNCENKFKRNYLRNEIIPKIKENLNLGLDQNILKLSQITKNSDEILTIEVQKIISKFVILTESQIKISKKIKMSAPLFLGEVFKQIIEDKFSVSIEYENYLSLNNLIDLQVGKRMELSHNLVAISEREYFIIKKKTSVAEELTEVKLYLNSEVEYYDKIIGCTESGIDEIQYSNSGDIEYIDADNLIEPLILRRWRRKDRFTPIGLNGTKLISDFLTERKVASLDKKDQLILLSDNKIIWIIGYRIDDCVKISKKTKRVVKLWVK